MKKLYQNTLLALLFAGAVPAVTYGQQVVVLTTNNSIGIIATPATPGPIIGPFPVTGVSAGQILEGIDFRPNTGELFALGYDPLTDATQLYIINQTTGVATAVNATPITLDLVAGEVGFDFNPSADRIRVTSSNGSNYRLNPMTGAVSVTDAALTFTAGDANSASTPAIVASAYSRSYIGSENTVLYNIDFDLNILTTQNPPNDGTQNTVGPLGISINPTDATVGFDIYYDIVTGNDMAFVSANTNASSDDNLYSINLTSGAVTSYGAITSVLGNVSARDIAVVITRTVPALTGNLIYALTQNESGLGNLITFDSENPGIIRTWDAVTGITADQKLLGLDFRPINGKLYTLGYNTTAGNYQLYTLDTISGVATAVNASPIALSLDTALLGFDFDPTTDRIRVTGAGGENYRLNPVDGTTSSTDLDLEYVSGDPQAGQSPYVASIAYTNSYPGAETTVLYAYDDKLNNLVAINPSNDGTCNTLNPSGLTTGLVGGYTSDMDIYYDALAAEDRIYFVANVASSPYDYLYLLNSSTFAFDSVGRIGYGTPVKDIAVPVGDAPSNLSVAENNNLATWVQVYPNPASDILYVKAQGLDGQSFLVMDLAGKAVMAAQNMNNGLISVSLDGMKSGVYFIRFEKGYSIRFVVKK